MNSRSKRRLVRTIVLLILLYLLGGVILFLAQERILFHPAALDRDHRFSFDHPFTELNLPYGEDNLSILRFHTGKQKKGAVLFFHGNRNHVEFYKKYPAFFIENGYDVWMIDYPGFGKTTGKRTEAVLYEQALMMYAEAVRETAADSIILYGKSIGTGIASFLASRKKSKLLVLETPYYSMKSLAKFYIPFYPVNWLMKYELPVNEYIGKTTTPVVIFHGTRDEVIPYAQSLRLRKEHKRVELVTIKKGFHNDLFDYELYQEKMAGIMSSGQL